MAQLACALSYRYWDLGSIPRSPTLSIIFLLTYFYAACHQKITIHSHLLACQVSQGLNLMASTGIPPCTLVNGSARDHWKVKKGQISWAKFLKYTSSRGLIPHGLHYL